MTAIREIYASYSLIDNRAPLIQFLEDRSAFELAQKGAKIFNRVVSILDNDSTREDDPILTIDCITDRRLEGNEPREISQDVINWLMDKRHMEKR
jgi:hypothetical protein